MSALSPKQLFNFTICTILVVYLLSNFNLLDSDQHKYYRDGTSDSEETVTASAMMLMHVSPVDYDYIIPSPPDSFLIPEIPESRRNLTGASLNNDNYTECRITSQVRVILSKPFWTMLAIDQHGKNFREGGDDFHVTFTAFSSSTSSLSEPETAVAFVSDQENGSYRLDFVGTSPPATTGMLLQPNSSTSSLLPTNQSQTPTTNVGTGILTVQILNKWRCSRNHHVHIDQLRHNQKWQSPAHPTILTYTKQDVPMPPALGL
jgi:hypothetical protein